MCGDAADVAVEDFAGVVVLHLHHLVADAERRVEPASPPSCRPGLSAACNSLLRLATPSTVLTCGVSTCTSRNGIEAELLGDAVGHHLLDDVDDGLGLVGLDEVEVARSRRPGPIPAPRRG